MLYDNLHTSGSPFVAAIPQVSNFEELLSQLQAAGYEIKPGKYISCRAPGQERFTRLKALGADYTEEVLRERISERNAHPHFQSSKAAAQRYQSVD